MLPFICGSSETCRTLANPKALDLSIQRYGMHCSWNWLKNKHGLRIQAAPRLHSSECSWEVGDGVGGSGVSPTFIFQGVGWTQEKTAKNDHFQGVVHLQAKISLHLNADNKSQTAPPTKEVHTFQSSSQYENINFKKSCPFSQVLSILEAVLEPEQILYSSALTR